MSQIGTHALKACLWALHHSGAARLAAPKTRGSGAILMLHHVLPDAPAGFAPNRLLQITPQFLDDVICEVRRQSYDTVTLSEARARLSGEIASPRPFVAFTFDDGYRDNRDHALPVLKRHGVPATIYITSDFADGSGFLWWLVLEQVIACRQFIAYEQDGRLVTLRCTSEREKTAAFDRIYWQLRTVPEDDARAFVEQLAEESGIDPLASCRERVMNWDELRDLAREPLIDFGAHTITHRALAKLPAAESFAEISGSIERLEAELGKPCRHFSYPYGDAGSAGVREFEIVSRLGLETAVTTVKGVLSPGLGLTALPRLSLNGHFQQMASFKALLSGLPFAMMDAVRRPAKAAAQSPGAESGFCIQRTSQPAGSTHASPPTT